MGACRHRLLKVMWPLTIGCHFASHQQPRKYVSPVGRQKAAWRGDWAEPEKGEPGHSDQARKSMRHPVSCRKHLSNTPLATPICGPSPAITYSISLNICDRSKHFCYLSRDTWVTPSPGSGRGSGLLDLRQMIRTDGVYYRSSPLIEGQGSARVK